MKRHFAYQHPTFGTAKNPKTASHWQNSVYYWWFEYLRRNEDYKRTCEKGGKGKCAKLYEDFGDIHSVDFKTWWTTDERGARLFAEPPTPSIRVIQGDAIVLGTTDNRSLVLEVPLNLPINHLVKRFREVVSKFHAGKRGQRHNAKSQARYQVQGKVDVGFLQRALQVLDERQAQPEKPLWKIANELRIVAKDELLLPTDSTPTARDKKNNLAATASRDIRKARVMIANAGKGLFPHAARMK